MLTTGQTWHSWGSLLWTTLLLSFIIIYSLVHLATLDEYLPFLHTRIFVCCLDCCSLMRNQSASEHWIPCLHKHHLLLISEKCIVLFWWFNKRTWYWELEAPSSKPVIMPLCCEHLIIVCLMAKVHISNWKMQQNYWSFCASSWPSSQGIPCQFGTRVILFQK